MLYFPQPVGDSGRLSKRARSTTLPLFGFAYYAGLIVTAVFGMFLFSQFGSKPHVSCCPLIPIGVAAAWLYWFAEVTPLSRRWDQAVRPSRTLLGYLTIVGYVTGALVGSLILASSYVLPEPSAEITNVFVLLLGPIPGIAWVLVRRHYSVDFEFEGYDDMSVGDQHLTQVIELASLAATESFGRRFGSLLFPNAVVALIGPLGAGKTHLARAIAEGLGVANPAAVTSPTFTLIHEYPARLPIFHFDAYRLNNADQFLDLGATEYYEAGGVCLIEWADRVDAALPEERLTIRIEIMDENRRRITLSAAGKQHEGIIESLRENASP